MKKRIIVTAAITACLALCAAVWPQAETVEKTPAPSETVSMEVLMKICKVLNCDIGDIMELLPEEAPES